MQELVVADRIRDSLECDIQRHPVHLLGHGLVVERHTRGKRCGFIPFGKDGKPLLVDAEGEGTELPVSDQGGFHLADVPVCVVLRDLEDRLGLVVELRPDVPADIVVRLVQVKDGVDMEVVLAAPSHQQANHFRGLS